MSIESVMLSNNIILCCLSSCFQSFPASGSFLMSQLFASGGQSIGASASASVLPMNIPGWLPLGLTGLVSLMSKEKISRCSKALILHWPTFFMVQLSNSYMTSGKNIALTKRTFANKAMPLLFNMLSRFDITFCPRSKHLLISWLQSPSAVILKSKKLKSVTASTFSLLLA